MGSGSSTSMEDVTHMMEETDPYKQKATSKKIFKPMDAKMTVHSTRKR